MGLQEWFGLEGKRALVTGASRGLGREMALARAAAWVMRVKSSSALSCTRARPWPTTG